MARWSLVFTPDAQNDFGRLDNDVRLRISDKLEWLQNNFDKITPAPLGGEWKDYFKLRAGGWRVIYKVNWNENLIIVYVIDRRDKVYKRL